MDSDSISEELFDDYIEYDGLHDLDANKENQPDNADDTIKQPRVSKEQYAKMDQFHKDHSEALVEGTIYDELWDALALKLNEIGPSVQSVQEWRKKWAARKYYHKQRLKNASNSEQLSVEKPSHSHRFNHSVEAKNPLSGHSSFEKEVLEKLDRIVNKLNEVIQILSGPETHGKK